MSNRNIQVFEAYLQQAGDLRDVDLAEPDRYCQCITSAARVILKGYLTERGVDGEPTVFLTPLLNQCRKLHVVLPSNIRQACTIWDEWERLHKQKEFRVTGKKLYCGTMFCIDLGDFYKAHISRNFNMIDCSEVVKDECGFDKECNNDTRLERCSCGSP